MSLTGLAADAITKRYGQLIAVDGLRLRASRGSVLALLGPNGAGKTTTLGMLSGTARPDAGQVSWQGRPASPEQLRQLVGLQPQSIQLWPRLSSAEQLHFIGSLHGLPRSVARERAARLLDRLGLTAKGDVQARRLSGGMQRRLNLAMALVNDPEVVVLDEPAAGLDPQSRVLVRDLISELSVDKVVIVTSHDMAEVERLADQIVIMDHGRAIASGSAAELLAGGRLGATVKFSVAAADGQALAAVVRSVAPDRTVTIADGVVGCRLEPGGTDLSALMAAVGSSSVPVRAVHTTEATLEDLFLDLTGRSLRE